MTQNHIRLPAHLQQRLIRTEGPGVGKWRGRFGRFKDDLGMRPEDMGTPPYEKQVQEYLARTPDAWQQIVRGTHTSGEIKPLRIEESLLMLTEGFRSNALRNGTRTRIEGIAFQRIAGQAFVQDDPISRAGVKRILEGIKEGGVFVVLGHGGEFGCGAVAARQAQGKGVQLREHTNTMRLLENLPDDLHHMTSPAAEWHNATIQALKIIADVELGEIIRERNITVAYAVAVNYDRVIFQPMNRNMTQDVLLRAHPKLDALRGQLEKAVITAAAEDKGPRHFSHVAILRDPLDMMGVLSPQRKELDVGGICCVDARLTPNTADNLFRAHGGEKFSVGVTFNDNHVYPFGPHNGGSLSYYLRHVAGGNILAGDGSGGNGHILALASSIERAELIEHMIRKYDDVIEVLRRGGSITLAGFDGSKLVIRNDSIRYCEEIDPLQRPSL